MFAARKSGGGGRALSLSDAMCLMVRSTFAEKGGVNTP